MANLDPNPNLDPNSPNRDPNFPSRDPRFDPAVTADRGFASGWTLGIGVVVVLLIVGFLAFGNNHNGTETASTPPGAPSAMNPKPLSPPATATLPAARNPAETNGSAPISK
ncbi:MAG: hypothetical protein ACR2K5_03575 [Pseudolabrys sp.]